jgi:V/A-type H+-transporting ATPase subunit D
MAAIKLTKNELKRQKDALKRFTRYLPTLMLKKQQLQMVIRQVEQEIQQIQVEIDRNKSQMKLWLGLFNEEVGFKDLIVFKEVRKSEGNIAGVDIPVFEGMEFSDKKYDLYSMPLWVDTALEKVKDLLSLEAKIHVLREQERRLAEELRITTQRVNLFEKVKIPETKSNIRKIQIYLGDQQTAAVVRGKMAKAKVVSVA